MKKILKTLLALVLSFLTVASLSSCGKNEMEKFLEKTTGDNPNYEMVMTTNVFGIAVEMKMQVDGNITHTEDFMGLGEQYIETKENSSVIYTKAGTTWTKEVVNSSESENPMDDLDGITAADFEEKDGKWILNDEKAKEFSFTELSITFEDGDANMEMKANEAGLVVSATVKFTKFGDVKLELPKI